MSTLLSNIPSEGLFGNYASDVGVTLVFGLGYYIFNSLKKKINSKSSTDDWSDNTNEGLKSMKGKIEGALARWQYAKTLDEYHELIKSDFNEGKDPFSVLNQMNKKGIMPTIDTYNVLLLNSFIGNNFDAADVLKEEICDPMGPVSPNSYTLNILIKGLGLRYKTLIKSPEECKDLHSKFDRELMQLITFFEQRDIYLDVIAQNTILDSLVEMGRLSDAWNQYCSMKRKFSPDLYTYTTLLKGIKQTPEIPEEWLDRAFLLLEEAKMCYNLDEAFFNCLLDACIKFNAMARAESLFREMKDKGTFQVTEYSYNIMLKGYSKGYMLDSALKMFECIKELHTPNAVSYGAVINACIRCKNIPLAEAYMKEMTENKIEKNLQIYSMIVNGYRVTKQYSKAIELYESLIQQKDIELNVVFFNSILDCCVDGGIYEKMHDIFTYIKSTKDNPQPDLITYSIVMKGYAKANLIGHVNELYSFLRTKKDLKLDEVLYNTLIDCYARHNDEENALRVFNDMKANGIKMNAVTYGVLIKLYANLNNCNKAFELFDDCIKTGVKPTVVLYQILIRLQIKSMFIDRAITLFRNMLVNGVKPDHIIYETIIKACLEQNREKDACEFVVKSLSDNIKLPDYLYEKLADAMISCDDTVFKFHERVETASTIVSMICDNPHIHIDSSHIEKFNGVVNNLSARRYQQSSFNRNDNYTQDDSLYNMTTRNTTTTARFNKGGYQQQRGNGNGYRKKTGRRTYEQQYSNEEEHSIYS